MNKREVLIGEGHNMKRQGAPLCPRSRGDKAIMKRKEEIER